MAAIKDMHHITRYIYVVTYCIYVLYDLYSHLCEYGRCSSLRGLCGETVSTSTGSRMGNGDAPPPTSRRSAFASGPGAWPSRM
jgi:hypothetical protein